MVTPDLIEQYRRDAITAQAKAAAAAEMARWAAYMAEPTRLSEAGGYMAGIEWGSARMASHMQREAQHYARRARAVAELHRDISDPDRWTARIIDRHTTAAA